MTWPKRLRPRVLGRLETLSRINNTYNVTVRTRRCKNRTFSCFLFFCSFYFYFFFFFVYQSPTILLVELNPVCYSFRRRHDRHHRWTSLQVTFHFVVYERTSTTKNPMFFLFQSLFCHKYYSIYGNIQPQL